MTQAAETPKRRTLSEIARDVRKHWPRVYFGAVPYLEAMATMGDIGGSHGEDSGRSVVNYFLANAQSFRGPEAKRIKAELRGMLGKGG